jgi:hypothetical protein
MHPLWSLVRRRGARGSAQLSSQVVREAILRHGLNARRALALADTLEAEGKLLEAVEALQTANRLRRNPVTERRLTRLRRAAFALIDRSSPLPAWPPLVPQASWPGLGPTPAGVVGSGVRPEASVASETGSEFTAESPGPPVVTAAQLTAALLRYGILRHGCILVRGLVGVERVKRLVEVIEHAFAAYDAHAAGAPVERTAPWFDPIEGLPNAGYVRSFVRNETGVLTGDSPRALYELLETIADLGLDRLLTSYLGERPALSLEKCTLRRAEPTQTGNAWHQDGAFIGDDIRSINAWFSLSRCGRTAPGLDIIPIRVDRILPVGTPGALYSWDVSADVVRAECPGPFWRPEFEPGDVLFFDHFCIHRTGVNPATMAERRWAIESWFFAPSVYPKSQTPLVV